MKNLLTVAILIVLIVTGIWLTKPTIDSGTYTVKIGYFTTVINDAPLFIADELGWLKDAGITYELIPLTTSNQALEGVISGRLDLYTAASILPILLASIISPDKLKLFNVAVLGKEQPFDALLTLKENNIALWEGIEGKSIGIYPGSTAQKIVKKILTAKGVDVSKVKIVPLPPQNHIPSLLNGSIDLLHAYEPTIAILKTTGKVKEVYGSLYADLIKGGAPIIGGAISAEFIKSHPNKVETIIRTLDRGYSFMQSNEKEARTIIQQRLNLSPEAASKISPLFGALGSNIDMENVQEFSDLLYDMGELPERVNINSITYKRLVD